MEQSLDFKTYEQAQEYIVKKSQEYGSKINFTSSEEYRKLYPKIISIFKKERMELGSKGQLVLNQVKQKIGDHVYYDSISSFGHIEKYEGVIILGKYGIPKVRLDNSRKIIKWHKGFRKL